MISNRLCRQLIRANGGPPPGISGGLIVDRPEKVLQFGEGSFLRGFADWMIDILNERGLFNGSVVVVQPVRDHKVADFAAQDGLYTVVLRGVHDGQVTKSRRLVTSINRTLSARSQWPELVGAFCQPDLRFILSNTTEAGIAWKPESLSVDQPPESFPAKVTVLLHHRFRALRGDPARGLVFLPCELIDRNGDTLSRFVLQHAEAWKLGSEFITWVGESHCFLNTLVDRIVTGFDPAEAGRVAAAYGAEDHLLVAGEEFGMWVIEGPASLAEEIPLHRAGLNVTWVDDLAPSRTRKVRLLNGAHTGSALVAFLGGLDTVAEMMADPVFGALVRQMVLDEILPTVPGVEAETRRYAESVLDRFANPFLRHRLLDISLNSIAKWKARVLPTLLDFQRSRGFCPPGLVFSLAALIAFYCGSKSAAGGWVGRRVSGAYPIRDDMVVLETFGGLWSRHASPDALPSLVCGVLAETAFWGMDLNRVAGLSATVTHWLRSIVVQGARAAAERLALSGGTPGLGLV